MNERDRLLQERLDTKLRVNAEIVVGNLEAAKTAQKELKEIDMKLQRLKHKDGGQS